MSSRATRVLFVCLGNICRSPTAHAVFADQVAAAGLQQWVEVDSAGTGAWHVGEAPDARATAAALRRGYDLSSLRARQVQPADFARFDYVLAMDADNLANLQALAPPDFQGHLGLFLDFHPRPPVTEVPDPYYGGEDGFDRVLDLIEGASQGLLHAITDP
ncbi:MAG: low molecular weight protein-tyrosine-phosphatase [Halieaceae bacterium]|jgi:protein-tyrosine phosphatase|nr:low molecular weight protein-tyrosine-phosphatase [Halieaceae bacterium]